MRRGLAFVVAALAPACALVAGFDEHHGTDAGTDGSSNDGLAGDAATDALLGSDGDASRPPPATIASSPQPRRITTNGKWLVWTRADGVVTACTIAKGCSDAVPVTPDGGAYTGIDSMDDPAWGGPWLDGDDVLWSVYTAHAIFRCHLPSCSVPESFGVAGTPTGVAADANGVYWVGQGPDGAFRALRDGGSQQTIATNVDGVGFTGTLAATTDAVYWIAGASGGIPGAAFVAKKSDTDLNQRQPLRAGLGDTTTAIAVHEASGTVYVGAAGDGGAIFTSGNDQGGVGRTSFAVGAGAIGGIAVDDRDVYWTNQTDGTVRRCARAVCPTGASEVLADGQPRPLGITLTATDLYWVNGSGGAIMQAKKR